MATELPSEVNGDKLPMTDNMSLSEFLHLSVKAESLVDGALSSGNEPLLRDQDELLDTENIEENNPSMPLRELNFIIDTSAFLQGLGNVKRWFDATYATAQIKKYQGNGAEPVVLNCYIPGNTLKELNYFKRNSSIEGPDAKRALKFIDHVLDLNNGMSAYDDEDSSSHENGILITYNIDVEERSASYPSWNMALRYAIHKDWPHEIDLGSKFLIRSCISKVFLDKTSGSSWRVITENKARHCINLFGIDCLNVNEAELLLFRALDVTLAQPPAPGAGFNYQYDMYDNANIMTKIDTSLYGYRYIADQNRASGMVDENTHGNVVRPSGRVVEDFDSVNYESRPKGTLWSPPADHRKKFRRKKRVPNV